MWILSSQIISPNVLEATPDLPSAEGQILKVTLVLAGILILIYGLAWFLKRNQIFKSISSVPIKVVSSTRIGVKEKLIIIDVNGEQLLLGVTPQSIHCLTRFDEPIVDVSQSQNQSFAHKLKDYMSRPL